MLRYVVSLLRTRPRSLLTNLDIVLSQPRTSPRHAVGLGKSSPGQIRCNDLSGIVDHRYVCRQSIKNRLQELLLIPLPIIDPISFQFLANQERSPRERSRSLHCPCLSRHFGRRHRMLAQRNPAFKMSAYRDPFDKVDSEKCSFRILSEVLF